jgi:hypothetical protein
MRVVQKIGLPQMFPSIEIYIVFKLNPGIFAQICTDHKDKCADLFLHAYSCRFAKLSWVCKGRSGSKNERKKNVNIFMMLEL